MGLSKMSGARLEGKVALVTGASRGVGRGVAISLAREGAFVYLTARSYEENQVEKRLPGSLQSVKQEIIDAGGECCCVQCDHTNDDQTRAVIEQIKKEKGKLDILVNNAFAIPKPAAKFFHQPFYSQPIEFLDTVMNVGVRNHYVCTVLAAELLMASKGLVVNISSPGGQNRLFNVSYGVSKCALDRMAVDMGHDLQPKGVTCISLWPGMVKTERMLMGAELMGGMEKVQNEGESPEFVGLVVAALASDEHRLKRTARIWTTRKLASEYGVKDGEKEWPVIDEDEPQNIFSKTP